MFILCLLQRPLGLLVLLVVNPVVVSGIPVVESGPPVVESGIPVTLPVDCSDLYNNGFGNSGVYTIFPAGPTSPVQVFCEMGSMDAPDSDKWTVMYKLASFSVSHDSFMRPSSLECVHLLVENVVKLKKRDVFPELHFERTVQKNTPQH